MKNTSDFYWIERARRNIKREEAGAFRTLCKYVVWPAGIATTLLTAGLIAFKSPRPSRLAEAAEIDSLCKTLSVGTNTCERQEALYQKAEELYNKELARQRDEPVYRPRTNQLAQVLNK